MRKLFLGIFLASLAAIAPAQAQQSITVKNATVTSINGVAANCVHADTNGKLSGTGSDCSAGGGTPGGSSGQIQWNSSSSFAGFTMAGDCTIVTSTGVITCGKLNGVAFGTSPATDTIPVITSSNTATYKAVPDCTDTGGNHLNYTASTHAVSCGTSSSGGGGGTQVLILTKTCTSVAVCNFTTGISTTYTDYLLLVSSVEPATAGANLLMQFATGGCVTMLGQVYWAKNGIDSNGSAIAPTSGNNAGSIGIINNMSNSAVGSSARIQISNLANTVHKTFSWAWTVEPNSGSQAEGTGGGLQGDNTADDSICFSMSSGNITTMQASLYGITH